MKAFPSQRLVMKKSEGKELISRKLSTKVAMAEGELDREIAISQPNTLTEAATTNNSKQADWCCYRRRVHY